MLIAGHYLKRLKPINYPCGDVLLANYRTCARGHVLELQRVANQRQKSVLNDPLGCCLLRSMLVLSYNQVNPRQENGGMEVNLARRWSWLSAVLGAR